MRVIEWMVRGMTHLNSGAALAMQTWIVWSDASAISSARPIETKFVSIPILAAQALGRVFTAEEKQS